MHDLDMQLHLAILGPRDYYCIVAKNHGTNETKTLWLKKDEVVEEAKRLNDQGFTVWISLNDKEPNNDTIKGVKALQDLWFDIDSKRKDKSMPATKEELQEALERANKLLRALGEQYNAVGFMALSGNGFHLHFPLPRFELVGDKFREEVNEKLRAFARRLASAAGVEIDKTYDIRRVTTLVGSFNLKIPDLPLQTSWDKTIFEQGFENAAKMVEEARAKNRRLLEAILNEPVGGQSQPVLVQSKEHPPLEDLLNKDEKLKDLYEGNWQKYNYPSRSEAEMALVTKLVFYGFSDGEIDAVMSNAKIGKWQEKERSYKELTIRKAKEAVAQQLQEEAKEREKEKEKGKEKPSKAEINLFSLAKEIIAQTPMITDMRTYLMYRWDGRVWVDDAEGYIHKKLVEVEGEDYKPYHLTTLTQMIQGLTLEYACAEPPPSLICFENGVLDLNTTQLMPHRSEYFFRNIIHANYKPGAKTEKFLKFLEEILPDEEDRKLVQEIFGYTFYRGYPLHHIFFFVGTGRNGKGVLIRTIQGILGAENCANVPIERLNERFQVTNLIGKLTNIVSEPDTRKISVEMIKALTGQDLISAEVKGKQKFINFTNYAKLIVAANRLPPINDKSIAWWERVVIVEFPITITDDKRVMDLEKQWLNDEEEKSGIVNWALEGLLRLLKNGKFTKSVKMTEIIEDYKRWSDPVDYFLTKRCLFAPNIWITKRELYEAYKEFCEDEGLPIVGEDAFGREVKKKPKVTTGQKKIQGKNMKIWVGIAIKPEGEITEVTRVTSSTDFGIFVKSRDNIINKENIVEKEREEKFKENIEPVDLVTPVTSTKLQYKEECCKNCQEFMPEYEICALDGQPKSPGFWCSNFKPKPKPKAYKCKCGCGPWKDYRLAAEHLSLFRGEEGHEIQEVHGE